MIHKTYSIYDEKAEAFIRPIFMPNEALAKRAIQTSAMDINHPFAQHPGDYVLYELGDFDDTTAFIHQLAPPARICTIAELIPDQADLMAIKPGEPNG